MIAILATAALSLLLHTAHAQSYDWGAMAIVSGTMGVNANRLCIGEATRGDIGCPDYAPSVTTAGMEVSGTISATAIMVNGVLISGSGVSTFASLTDVSYSAVGGNIFGPGSLAGANVGVTNSTAFGYGALSAPGNIGYKNSAFGYYALFATTTGTNNNAFGNSALADNTAGSANTAVGSSALARNTTAGSNSAFGASALSVNTTGDSNSAFGRSSMRYNDSGSENAAVGLYALFYNASGSKNTALGANSLYNFSSANATVAVGSRAAYGKSGAQYTITNSTIIGASAGNQLMDSQSNTLIGYNAGGGITTGSGNIVIGTSLSPYSNTGSNQLNLGNVLFGDLGNGSTLQGKLGINVTSPTQSLEVSGTVSATSLAVNSPAIGVAPGVVVIRQSTTSSSQGLMIQIPNGAYSSGRLWMDGSNNFIIGRGTSNTIIISNTGMGVGINGITPSTPLEVSGTVSATRFVGDGSGLSGIAANVSVTTGASGSIVYRDQFGSLFASSGLTVASNASTTGSVGIGASVPIWMGTNALYANGNIFAGNFFTQNSSGLSWGTGSSYIRGDGTSSNYLTFTTSGTEAMRIVSSGYVGIGNANPSATFHVTASNGTGSNSVFQLSSGTTTLSNVTTSGAQNWYLYSNGSNVGNIAYSTPGGVPGIVFTNSSGGGRTDIRSLGTSGGMAFYTSVTASTERLRIVSTGYVGIGTTTPTVALEVSGTVSATAFVGNGSGLTGIIIASETLALNDLSDVSATTGSTLSLFAGSVAGSVLGATNTTVFGIQALSSPTNSGYSNSAFGTRAMRYNTSGRVNSAFGHYALLSNTTGSNNTAFGKNALYNNDSGNANTAMGTYAGQGLTNGNSNTLVGYNAGGGITTGGNNIVIGASLSPYDNTGSNQLNIGNVLFGDLGLGSSLQGKLGVNITSPTQSLEVSGTISATRFVGDGSGLTGIAANDNIVSGSAYVKALQDTGALVSGSLTVSGTVSATGDVKGNTLQLVNAPSDTCSTANGGALKRVGNRFYFCRP